MNKREFTKLFHEYADAVYRFAYWRVGSEEQAQDITSIVFTKAWEKREGFDNKHPKAWLFTIARNTIIDGYRKKSESLLDEDFDLAVEDDTAERLDKDSEKQVLMRALSSLSEELREIVHLRFIERASVQETAERTGKSESNVRVMQFRALQKLRVWYEAQS